MCKFLKRGSAFWQDTTFKSTHVEKQIWVIFAVDWHKTVVPFNCCHRPRKTVLYVPEYSSSSATSGLKLREQQLWSIALCLYDKFCTLARLKNYILQGFYKPTFIKQVWQFNPVILKTRFSTNMISTTYSHLTNPTVCNYTLTSWRHASWASCGHHVASTSCYCSRRCSHCLGQDALSSIAGSNLLLPQL